MVLREAYKESELKVMFYNSDSIIIVDNAQAPMLDNVKLALKTVIEYGYSILYDDLSH